MSFCNPAHTAQSFSPLFTDSHQPFVSTYPLFSTSWMCLGLIVYQLLLPPTPTCQLSLCCKHGLTGLRLWLVPPPLWLCLPSGSTLVLRQPGFASNARPSVSTLLFRPFCVPWSLHLRQLRLRQSFLSFRLPSLHHVSTLPQSCVLVVLPWLFPPLSPLICLTLHLEVQSSPSVFRLSPLPPSVEM